MIQFRAWMRRRGKRSREPERVRGGADKRINGGKEKTDMRREG